MIALDCETTGLDGFHGARPFLVTICCDGGEQMFWEWQVDPLTRRVLMPDEHVLEISEVIRTADRIVGQNIKFDYAMLRAADARLVEHWDWTKIDDTLILGHLLASNRPHNLTALATQYLGRNIEPKEDAVDECVKKCRREVQQAQLRIKRRDTRREQVKEAAATRLASAATRRPGRRGAMPHHAPKPGAMPTQQVLFGLPPDEGPDPIADWAIAAVGRPDMPSAKGETWKFDMWLPRALALHRDLPVPKDDCQHLWGDDFKCSRCLGHRWWVVTSDYANTDSETTLLLWHVMYRKLRQRKLEPYYRERMKSIPVAVGIEAAGVTVSQTALDKAISDYACESVQFSETCVDIAESYGIELSMPKGGNNKSLTETVSEMVRGCDARELPYTDGGQIALNKDSLPILKSLFDDDSPQCRFFEALDNKRKRDTAVTYMTGYKRFWLPYGGDLIPDLEGWYILHSTLNPTGTATLRWSSVNVNSQNYSKKEGFNLRKPLGPAPGREWWSLDAKNIELRIPFYKSGDKDLIDLFERSNEPPYYGSNHILNFHTIYPDLWEAELGGICSEETCCNGKVVDLSRIGPHLKKKYAATWYQWCKNFGFAVQYQAGPETADRAAHRKGCHFLLKSRFKGLDKLNQDKCAFAEKYGYVETEPDVTIDPLRGYPLLCTRTEWNSILPTVPLSYYVQSTAMWWTMKAMIRTEAILADWRRCGFDAYLIMQVHDELVFDLPARANPKTNSKSSNLARIRVIQKAMEEGGNDIGVPTPVGLEFHAVSWADGITF